MNAGKEVNPEEEKDSTLYLKNRNFDGQEHGVDQYNENKKRKCKNFRHETKLLGV